MCSIAVGMAERAVRALDFWQIWKLGGEAQKGHSSECCQGRGLTEERRQGQGLRVRSQRRAGPVGKPAGLRQH